MKLFYKDEAGRIEDVIAKNCTFPKMTGHGGRSWDIKDIYINDVKYRFYYDTTWGRNYYFVYDGKSYSIDVIDFPSNKYYTLLSYAYHNQAIPSEMKNIDDLNSMFFNTVYELKRYSYTDLNEAFEHLEDVYIFKDDVITDIEYFMRIVENPNKVQIKIMKILNFNRVEL
jgi:hypothetical protein